MSVFVCGDTHGSHDFSKLNTTLWPEQKKLTKNDFLVVLGDFGVIWSHIPDKEEKYLLRQYSGRNFTTLFIDGNHENHDRLDKLPVTEMFGGKVGVVNDSVIMLKRGEVYTIEGNKIFCFGGAMSTDKLYRKEFVSWWSQEVPSYDEMNQAMDNLDNHGWSVDYILTHTAPSYIVNDIGYTERINDPTSVFLERVGRDIAFRSWHFGHFHKDEIYQDKYCCHYNSRPYQLF